jgi:hypothetical protein
VSKCVVLMRGPAFLVARLFWHTRGRVGDVALPFVQPFDEFIMSLHIIYSVDA